MLKIKIISLFPDLIQSYLKDAIIAKAIGKNLLRVELVNLRDFSDNAYKSVDEAPFGGGDGMLIRADILEKALQSVQNKNLKQLVVYFTPQGKLLDQSDVADTKMHVIFKLLRVFKFISFTNVRKQESKWKLILLWRFQEMCKPIVEETRNYVDMKCLQTSILLLQLSALQNYGDLVVHFAGFLVLFAPHDVLKSRETQ
jgi:hypothetical protein